MTMEQPDLNCVNPGTVASEDIPASIRKLSYPRNDYAASSLALDEHEKLMKEGWECLGALRIQGKNLVISYLKRSAQ